jgi:dTDP-4-amino-4,6-dideoxygalactose transaminase
MISKLPIIDFPLNFKEFVYGLKHNFDKSMGDNFTQDLAKRNQLKHVFLVNSGTTAFYVILQALKERSTKKEVILPAYTATVLVNIVFEVGLKPVLCDITLTDFSLDREQLFKIISSDTLAVVLVHMFGIVIDDIQDLRKRIPSDVFLLEDCAQSFGSTIREKPIGCLGDASFFSFNRGKNLSTLGGGCVATDNQDLALKIGATLSRIQSKSELTGLAMAVKFMLFSLILNRFFYGVFYPLIYMLKMRSLFKGINIKKYSCFQASIALQSLKGTNERSRARYANGMKLIQGLKGLDGIVTATIKPDIKPAFNRFPIVFKDQGKLILAERILSSCGIETSRLYQKSLSQLFNLGYKEGDMPNADYFAGHLLTLPVHPSVSAAEIDIMILALRKVMEA